MSHTVTRRLGGLTAKGTATVALIAVRDTWEQLTPSQQAECEHILERLAVAMRRQHPVADRTPSAVRVPLVGRLSA